VAKCPPGAALPDSDAASIKHLAAYIDAILPLGRQPSMAYAVDNYMRAKYQLLFPGNTRNCYCRASSAACPVEI